MWTEKIEDIIKSDNPRYKRFALSHSEEFVRIKDKDINYYGGNQNWFEWRDDEVKSFVATFSGCGSVAISNILAYLSKGYEKYKGLCTCISFEKEEYLNYMKDIYTYTKPFHMGRISFGIFSARMMRRRVKRLSKAYNTELDIVIAKKYDDFDYLCNYISETLKNDLPIAMLIGRNGKEMNIYYAASDIKKGEFMYHWVTITEIVIDEVDKEAYLRVSSWGRSAYISLREYMRFELIARSLFYII